MPVSFFFFPGTKRRLADQKSLAVKKKREAFFLGRTRNSGLFLESYGFSTHQEQQSTLLLFHWGDRCPASLFGSSAVLFQKRKILHPRRGPSPTKEARLGARARLARLVLGWGGRRRGKFELKARAYMRRDTFKERGGKSTSKVSHGF